jgi:hypothetical protein
MKTVLSLLFIVLLGAPAAFCQEIGKQEYTGRAEIADLGVVVFPPGKWQLEFRIPPPKPNPTCRPDYFGFRKVGEPVERLGFRRYSPEIAPQQLIGICDGLQESFGLGAPSELVLPKDAEPEVEMMRLLPDNLAQVKNDISISFITRVPKAGQVWLCHAHVYSWDGWAYVVFHSSTAVLDPDIVRDLEWISPKHAK